jgi:hypothetical protein
MKKEVLAVENVIHADGARPPTVEAVVNPQVSDEPGGETLVGVGIEIRVIERRIELAAGACGRGKRPVLVRLIREQEGGAPLRNVG